MSICLYSEALIFKGSYSDGMSVFHCPELSTHWKATAEKACQSYFVLRTLKFEITLERIHVSVLLSKVRKVFKSCTYHSTKIYVRLWLFVRVSQKVSKCQNSPASSPWPSVSARCLKLGKGYNSSNNPTYLCSQRLRRFECCKNTKLATSCFSISVQSLQRDPKSHPCSYNV